MCEFVCVCVHFSHFIFYLKTFRQQGTSPTLFIVNVRGCVHSPPSIVLSVAKGLMMTTTTTESIQWMRCTAKGKRGPGLTDDYVICIDVVWIRVTLSLLFVVETTRPRYQRAYAFRLKFSLSFWLCHQLRVHNQMMITLDSPRKLGIFVQMFALWKSMEYLMCASGGRIEELNSWIPS